MTQQNSRARAQMRDDLQDDSIQSKDVSAKGGANPRIIQNFE